MHFILQPNVGASPLQFGMDRAHIRSWLKEQPFTKSQELENDFYEKEGLILGYDEENQLEFVEITLPSSAEFRTINFFSSSLADCIAKMNAQGFQAPFADGGYNFESIGITFYCPEGELESVAIYKKGYYDNL